MSNALTTLTNTLAAKLGMGEAGTELMSTLKATAFKGEATNDQFMALMIVANQYGLNPWTREIYAFPDKQNGIVPVVGVDGWSRIINGHPMFDGMSFEQDAEKCTCIIYRKDRGHPISATEYHDECFRPAFTNKSGYEIKGPWQSHPKRMLRHKAMIQCARLAFGYTGIYDQDEAERIVEVDVTPRTKAASSVQKAQIAQAPAALDATQEKIRNEIIFDLDRISSNEGLAAYGVAFMSLSKQDRLLIGAAEHERMKAAAAARDAAIPPAQDPDYSQAKVVDFSQTVDSFISEMEQVENV